MKSYENYRPCHSPNLNKMPSHWESYKLRYLAKIQTGTTPTSAKEDAFQEEGGLPWFTPDDLDETGAPSQARKFLTTQGEEEVKPIAAGSTLICCIESIGKAGIIEVVASSNQQINAVTFRESSRFGFYSILGCKEAMECLATGNVLRILNSTRLGSIELPLPPRNERELISQYLDRETAKIDALIAEQKRLIELLQEKRQAVFSHAVTKGLNPNAPMKDSGVEWLGEVPEHWEVKPLKHLATVQTGMAKGKDLEGVETAEVPYLRVANVQDGYLDLEEVYHLTVPIASIDRYLLRKGDVLMNEGGDFDKLGRGCMWAGEIEPCVHQNHVFAVRPHSVSGQWLNTYTSSKAANSYFIGRSKQSTNLASISSTNLMGLLVPVPPSKEASEILSYMNERMQEIDNLKLSASQAVDLLQERRSALISAAVTGQIDVRGLVIEEAGEQ